MYFLNSKCVHLFDFSHQNFPIGFCSAGIRFDDVTDGDNWPCMGDRDIKCEKYRVPTEIELVAINAKGAFSSIFVDDIVNDLKGKYRKYWDSEDCVYDLFKRDKGRMRCPACGYMLDYTCWYNLKVVAGECEEKGCLRFGTKFYNQEYRETQFTGEMPTLAREGRLLAHKGRLVRI